VNPTDEPMIVFYDGLCGFCDRTVQYILQRDRANRFRFAALQSDLAKEKLPKHGKNPADLNTLYLMVDGGTDRERVLQKSDAALRIGRELGGWTKVWMGIVGVLPRPLRDWGYDRVAKARYRIFGKLDACRIPAAEDRAKFIS
jgi:predicted DCC family thiol-disulfide oxidoreductase YuxK